MGEVVLTLPKKKNQNAEKYNKQGVTCVYASLFVKRGKDTRMLTTTKNENNNNPLGHP